MPLRRPLAFAAAGLVLSIGMAACSQPQTAGKADTPKVDEAFGKKVRAYLLEHPEILLEVSAKLQEKQLAEASAKSQGAIAKHRQAIERDPRDFVANPNGTITVTEFFDYKCGYCKLAAPQILEIIEKNPDVRFVFKEFVIFGHTSEVAARMAIGAQDQGKTLAVYKAMMEEKSLDDAAVDRLAKAAGVDVAKARAAGQSASVTQQLQDIQGLAQTLAIEGTPAFIVGDKMIPGADMNALKLAIEEARLAAKKKG
ncbi:disulfide bond formation protein DsbA [Caulobacter sp. D4A]|uniref:DsbA family protein n=1 Tax=unclassified Caulobacter TaxID=2648921 RepID=UPI000D732F1B|nr:MULTISPECIES: DsbA family protein [unclassified Caulobacter]PXA87203.1 disulfide bond formation protein DsbA [Caulobacter sp. D4A]PXA90026.1 disulfide bond formation protein DsbA [Caulobacter sp. D5]